MNACDSIAPYELNSHDWRIVSEVAGGVRAEQMAGAVAIHRERLAESERHLAAMTRELAATQRSILMRRAALEILLPLGVTP